MSKILRVAVLGAGHLGRIHIKILQASPDFELVGFYDPNTVASAQAEETLGVPAFSDMATLMDQVDVVDVVTPTLSHRDCAIEAIGKGKHVFIEKPISKTLAEAEEICTLSEDMGVKVQVGHVERFNPAFTAAQPHLNSPMFIEAHRLAQFNPRGTDVPVVLDLMIHDIDIVLHAVGSPVADVHASGVKVISDTPDIANARLVFENGCVANLTASRISMKNMRKSRFFQQDAYVSVDFLEKSTEIVSMNEVEGDGDPFAMVIDPGNGKSKREIVFNKPEVTANNAIADELHALHKAIATDTPTPVSARDGYNALSIAHRIMDCIDRSAKQ